MTTVDHSHHLAEDAVERRYDTRGRTSWGAILAGSVFALGLYVLLSLVGLALGFSLVEPDQATPMNGSLTTTTVWLFVSQLVALGIGGYAAGRLAGVLRPMGSMLHGAVVWALTTLVALYMATSAAMGIANIAGSAVSSVASGATSAVEAAIPEDFDLPDLSIGALSMDDLPDGVRQTLRENGLTPETFQAEAREAFRTVLSQQEQQRIASQATETATEIVTSPGSAGQDIEDFIDSTFGRGAILGEEDRQEALVVLQDRFDLSERDAESFLTYVQTRAETVQEEAEAALAEARTQAIEAADAAADATANAAWLAALASLAGLIAAAGGAYLGRPNRG
ncbi:hypothetical protein [Jannaschia formosa]|uniref:hypothetical protein n=1 Tax=Jannaschia formosa TaxID=2259592 RepID=UPI000E1BD1CD|nr:hypothetical protein [Jannaschia formosa]TFL19428.1 hypothetical protein DR046_05775 [Jannaschia formosa]